MNSRLLAPYRALIIWIAFTLFLFAFGPIEYKCDKLVSFVFIFFFVITSFLFYKWAVDRPMRKPRIDKRFDIKRILRLSIIYSVILTTLYVVEYIGRYGFKEFSFLSIIESMAISYTEHEEYSFMVSAWILSYTKWIRVIALVLGAFYWKELSHSLKFLYILLVYLIVMQNTLYVGSQKEIIDMAIYISVPIIMRKYRQGRKIKTSNKILIFCFFIAAMFFMGSVISGRRALWSDMYAADASLDFDQSNWMISWMPDAMANSFASISAYISQGYRGLSLCLSLPFEWSYGLGSSFKIMNDISRWFSIPIDRLANSYPVRMEQIYGVGAYSSWHSIFPWFASDFTFVGAIIVVCIFIYFWGKSWKEFIKMKTWISIVFFTHFTIMMLYIPCNNQLFQTRDSIISTFAIAVLWYIYHGQSAYLTEHEESSQ